MRTGPRPQSLGPSLVTPFQADGAVIVLCAAGAGRACRAIPTAKSVSTARWELLCRHLETPFEPITDSLPDALLRHGVGGPDLFRCGDSQQGSGLGLLSNSGIQCPVLGECLPGLLTHPQALECLGQLVVDAAIRI